MKLIGLDVGTKRIGVAKADTGTRIAVPDGVIPVSGQEFSEIARLARLYKTNIFVIGLPRNNSGQETQQSAYVRNFARQLAQTIPSAKIYFQDESLTSVEAERRLKARKKNYQKGEIDAEAAAIILQDCIEHIAANGRPPQSASASASEAASGASASAAPSDTAKTANSPKNASAAAFDGPEPFLEGREIKKGHKIGKIVGIAAVVVLVLLGATLGGGFIWYKNALKPVAEDANCKYATSDEQAASGESVAEACAFTRFSVSENESVAQIASNLQSAGLIRSSFAFQLYIRLNNYSALLQAGDYDFRPAMTSENIADNIANGLIVSNVFNFTIIPGETLSDIKARLISLGYTSEEIDAAFTKNYNSPILDGLYDASGNLQNSAQPRSVQLEGYLYGETYQFYNGESVENIIKRILQEFQEVSLGNDLKAKFAERGLTLREGIILASIVQKEAKSDDMPGVAQVFLNRIRTGMQLGSDVTATYAADLVDPGRNDLSDNLAILGHDNLYNTRVHTGLTPGPISTPSVTALLAVANPDDSHRSDYYFLTGDDGKMYYSTTAEGHEQNIRDHCQILCQVML